MYPEFYSKATLTYILYEVLKVENLSQLPYYQDHSAETFQMVLDSAHHIATKMLRPILTEMDRNEPQLIDGQVKVHEGMKAIIKKFGDDGWINAGFDYDEGGQQIPATVLNAAAFIFQAANYSASVFPFLSTGAANLLRSFGSETLKEKYLPKIYAGLWQGTMALTEPNAGSSLGDISTTAYPAGQPGLYKIVGQKIFISAGDHNAADNIVHLMLAKIEGAPAGAKGISLFVVPKFIENKSDELIDNDVVTAGVYHKMGYKGAPIVHLMVGSKNGCTGFLVGEPHQGLRYMFQMMNEARLGVGMNATAIASAAYQASLQYAKERPQGRKINEKNPTQPQVPIIAHADVKRMLLQQKAIVEGSLSLILRCSYYADMAHHGPATEQEKYALLLDLLTPIAKSYPSEMGIMSTSAAIQILGGAGYTTDFPVEQYYREARIHPIHEGTTGIHGLDLLGRKVSLAQGKAIGYMMNEVLQCIQLAKKRPELVTYAELLENNINLVNEVTQHLFALAQESTERYLADATLYLEMMGIVVIAWQWLEMALVSQSQIANDADFHTGKIMTMQYFFEYELVKVLSLSTRLKSSNNVSIAAKIEHF